MWERVNGGYGFTTESHSRKCARYPASDRVSANAPPVTCMLRACPHKPTKNCLAIVQFYEPKVDRC